MSLTRVTMVRAKDDPRPAHCKADYRALTRTIACPACGISCDAEHPDRFKCYAPLPAPVVPARATITTHAADAARVVAWAIEQPRRPANLAFTDGPERQAAYWIEWAEDRVLGDRTTQQEGT